MLQQFPGVSKDSAASGNLHVRNEHANLSYRLNGILLPDQLGTFGQILDTGFIGSLTLITGALPVQYGLRTAGIVDMTTRSGAFDDSGSISVYGGSHGTLRTSFEYGGRTGSTEYYFSGSYLQNILGIENPTSSYNAIHDFTQQDRGFAYISTIIDPYTRLSLISGASVNQFQIPNNPGQPPTYTAFGQSNFDSSKLNENQIERYYFTVLALQKSVGDVDTQLSYFTRYASVHFTPDYLGDLMFNGIATDVYRRSETNGIQSDTAWRVNDAHTLRAGFSVSAEKTLVTGSSLALPLDSSGGQSFGDTPFPIYDSSSLLGWLGSIYAGDEWRITDKLTLNAGLRFDQMNQYVNANQLSPRASITYKPTDDTTFHFGYARTFTPPVQVIAAPTNTALFTTCPPPLPAGCTTVQAPGVPGPYAPMQPERAHVFDTGVVQKVLPGLEVGVDAYYKIATNLIDDGQFGAAYVLNGFNYANAENVGVELKAKYTSGNFNAYGNIAFARQMATNWVTNQYLADPSEFSYIAHNYIFTDHAQQITGSAGMSYLWNGTKFSADMIYGSGLRAGFANTDHVPAYSQVNLGVSHEFRSPYAPPTTLRFDIVNVFDSVYLIRDGSGIGVFAPQYGPRRGFYLGLSQKFGPGADKAPETPAYSAFPTKAPPAGPAPFLTKAPFYTKAPFAIAWTWSGFYLGTNIGYSFGSSKTDTVFNDASGGTFAYPTSASSRVDGLIGGAQTGYNWQMGNWLAGIEGDLQLSRQRGNPLFTCPGTVCNPAGPVTASFDPSQKMEWFATLRGRFGGLVTPDLLAYVTGGVALGGFNNEGSIASFDATGAPAPDTFVNLATRVGWTAGAGIEGHLGGNWTGKVEYLHLDFGSVSTTAYNDVSAPLLAIDLKSHITDDIVRVGLNYKFGALGAIVTKY